MADPLRLLHLEDDALDVELIQAKLTLADLSVDIHVVRTRADYVAALRQSQFDLILADYLLPDFDGLTALRLAREISSEIPFIFVTGELGEERAIETLVQGATDYVLKTRLSRLAPAVRRALEEARERQRRKAAEAEARAEHEWMRVTLASIGDAVIATDTQGRITFMNGIAEGLTGWSQTEAQGLPIATVFRIINEDTRATVDSPVDRVLREGRISGLANHTLLLKKDGQAVPIDDSGAPIQDSQGQLIGVILVFRDISARQEVENVLATRIRQQAVVADLGQRALAGSEITDLIQTAVRLAAETLRVEFSKVLELLADGTALKVIAGIGWRAGVVGQALVEAGPRSQAGYTLHSGVPILVTNLKTETRFVGMPLLHEHGVISGMTVIIPGRDRPYGVFGIHTAERRTFTPDDANFLQSLANILAEAIARVRVEVSVRESEQRYRSLVEATTSIVWTADATGAFTTPQSSWEAYTGQPQQAYTGMGWLQAIHPNDRDGVSTRFAHACAVRGVYESQARLWHAAANDYRYYVTRAVPLLDERGNIREWIGTLTDIHERKLVQLNTEQNAERTQRLQSLTAVLAEALTVGQVLEVMLQHGMNILGAQAGAVMLLSSDGQTLESVRTTGFLEQGVLRNFSLADPLPAAEVARSGNPIWIEAYPELAARFPAAASWPSATDDEAVAYLPLEVEQRRLGVAAFSFLKPRAFSPEDQTFLMAVVRQCAQALDRALLFEAEREAHAAAEQLNAELEARVRARTEELEVTLEELRRVNASLEKEVVERRQAEDKIRQLSSYLQRIREEESTRIAREIHDELGGAMTGLKMDVVALRKALNETQSYLVEKADSLAHAIDATVQTIRRIATDLRPGILDDLGLPAAIEWQLQEFERRAGIPCKLSSQVDVIPLDGNSTTAIFRVLQETLTNVARHAQASEVRVRLEEAAGYFVLQVQDNGRGISDTDLAGAKSLGLLGMRERVRMLAGELNIQSSPGQGTTVLLRVPLPTRTATTTLSM